MREISHKATQTSTIVQLSQPYLYPDLTAEIKKNAFIDMAKKLTLNEWQLRWDSLPNSVYKNIYPLVIRNTVPPACNNRKINRLRYGKTILRNPYQIVGIGKNCPSCDVPLNTAHLLLTCNLQPITITLKNYCNSHKIPLNLQDILTNEGCIRLILAANI